jgi:hypothetical protein
MGHGHLLIRSRTLPRAVFTPTSSRPATTATTAPSGAVPMEGLDLMGLAVYEPQNAVDKVLKGARMHT